MQVKGKVSHFGGPHDTGVSTSEDLAWWEEWEDVVEDNAQDLFLPHQPPNTTGLARRLNPDKYYVACRWWDHGLSKAQLATEAKALVRAENGRQYLARPADYGPHEDTGRVADISPGLMTQLGIDTDDIVTVTYPADEDVEQPPAWTPRPRVVVDLSVPDGVELVLMINGVQLMPDEDH